MVAHSNNHQYLLSMPSVLVFIPLLHIIRCSLCFRNVYPFHEVIPGGSEAGEPLFLTPFIEAGKINEGRKTAEVWLPNSSLVSYTGFFTVNKSYESNLFFWFFPAEDNAEKAPVVLWLQGGPGASSINGLFYENGPYFMDARGLLNRRNTSWSKVFNMVYVDNPVGTGFSFTRDVSGYARDETDVGRDLYSALFQFFSLFPDLRKNDFFLTGESYAGKYVPAVAYTIHSKNQKNNIKINLKGLAIGDGWTVPEYMLDYGDYLYQLGLIDMNGKKEFLKEKQRALEYLEQKQYLKAKKSVDRMVSDFDAHATLYYNLTGLESCYNFVTDTDRNQYDFSKYIQSDLIRKKIHVGNLTFQNGDNAAKYLENDVMQSVKPWIEVLLEEYRILFYNGQLDIICAYPLTVNVLRHLEWSGTDAYKKALRKPWLVDGQLAGYTKAAKRMTEVLVRNSGHVVPKDQPVWALDMITKFVFNKSF